MSIEQEIEEFELHQFEEIVRPRFYKYIDKKRRKELSRLLDKMQYVFEVSDAETLNAIIKI
jgi:hypothetical protein